VVVDCFILLQVNNAGITGTRWSVDDPEIFRQKVSFMVTSNYSAYKGVSLKESTSILLLVKKKGLAV
jgi:hypothetical protein